MRKSIWYLGLLACGILLASYLCSFQGDANPHNFRKPNAPYLAFRCWQHNYLNLGVMRSDGSERKIINMNKNVGAFQWSPNGASIAFESVALGGKLFESEIQIMHFQGKKGSRIIARGNLGSWDSTGEHLFLSSPIADGSISLFKYALQSNKLEPIFLPDDSNKIKYDLGFFNPKICARTEKIALIGISRTGKCDILLLDLRSNKINNLTNDGTLKLLIGWSLDGKTLCYLKKKTRAGYQTKMGKPKDNEITPIEFDAYLAHLDNNAAKKTIILHGINDLSWPPWNNVIFASKRKGNYYHLYKINLTNQLEQDISPLKNTNIFPPALSADGSLLAFSSIINLKERKIWIMKSSGDNLKCISPKGADDQYPSWSPVSTSKIPSEGMR